MKFSLITIYGSIVTSKPLSCKGMRSFNESLSFMYTQLYNITSKLYFKTHFIKLINGPDEAQTRALLLVCPTP